MGHSNVRSKIRRRKVANLAARSRQFSVKNNTIHKLGLNGKNVIVRWDEIRTQRFDTPICGKMFEIDDNGHYHLIEREFDPTPLFISSERKLPKSLIKYKKRKYSNVKSYAPSPKDDKYKEVKREKRNDFVKHFPNYPYNLPKLNRIQYMEKLVEHKLAKWERKNPKPMDMFTEDIEKWNQLRENMKMHFRDVVVSIYDKLPLIGRFKMGETNATFMEKKIAEIKDINGEGHNINNLDKSSKLMKTAQDITDKIHAKHANLMCTNLKDHKRQKGRIICPTNLMVMRKAA